MSCLCRYIFTPGCICVECARARGFPQAIYANRAKAEPDTRRGLCTAPTGCDNKVHSHGLCIRHGNDQKQLRGVA